MLKDWSALFLIGVQEIQQPFVEMRPPFVGHTPCRPKGHKMHLLRQSAKTVGKNRLEFSGLLFEEGTAIPPPPPKPSTEVFLYPFVGLMCYFVEGAPDSRREAICGSLGAIQGGFSLRPKCCWESSPSTLSNISSASDVVEKSFITSELNMMHEDALCVLLSGSGNKILLVRAGPADIGRLWESLSIVPAEQCSIQIMRTTDDHEVKKPRAV